MFNPAGRVVLISGGNAGIGLTSARGVARVGGDVVIRGRRAERNAEAAKYSGGTHTPEAAADQVIEHLRHAGVLASPTGA